MIIQIDNIIERIDMNSIEYELDYTEVINFIMRLNIFL